MINVINFIVIVYFTFPSGRKGLGHFSCSLLLSFSLCLFGGTFFFLNSSLLLGLFQSLLHLTFLFGSNSLFLSGFCLSILSLVLCFLFFLFFLFLLLLLSSLSLLFCLFFSLLVSFCFFFHFASTDNGANSSTDCCSDTRNH